MFPGYGDFFLFSKIQSFSLFLELTFNEKSVPATLRFQLGGRRREKQQVYSVWSLSHEVRLND